MVGKPNQIIPKAQLQPLSAVQEQNHCWLCWTTTWDEVWKPVFVDHHVCIHQISWNRAFEKYQSKGYSQSFNQVLYTGRSSKFYQIWSRFQFWQVYFNKWCWNISQVGITVSVIHMSPSKSRSSWKMAPNTKKHDMDLLFWNRERLGREYPCTIVCCTQVSTRVPGIQFIQACVWAHCERTS